MSSLLVSPDGTNLLSVTIIGRYTRATYIIQNWWRKHQLKHKETMIKACEARIAVLERKLHEFEEYGGTLDSDEEGYMNSNNLF
jgi:hypothetical protein